MFGDVDAARTEEERKGASAQELDLRFAAKRESICEQDAPRWFFLLTVSGRGLERSSPPDTLRRHHGQAFAVEIQVDQREVGAQPVMVLGQAAVPHLVEAEDTLQDAERVLDPGPHT
jgi:hypothetical protein